MPKQVNAARRRARTNVRDHEYTTPVVREVPRPANPDAVSPKTTRRAG
jgi:hypothetical protein